MWGALGLKKDTVGLAGAVGFGERIFFFSKWSGLVVGERGANDVIFWVRTGEVLDVDEAGAKFWIGKEKCWQR